MTRQQLLQTIIDKEGYEDFLELGVFVGWTFDNLKVKNKLGSDISRNYYVGNGEVIGGTTDSFFEHMSPEKMFDLIFIDADHTGSQVKKDLDNALKHIKPNGTIVMHDMSPPTFKHTTDGVNGCWNGTTFKALFMYDGNFPFTYVTVDTDWGLSILKPSEVYHDPRFNWKRAQEDWDYFDHNRKELLHLISVEEFKAMYK